MKKTLNLFVFSLFLLGVCAFTTAEWYRFESKPFGFKIEFPVKPVEKTKPLSTASGEVTLNMFEYDASKDTLDLNQVYMASYVEYAADIDGDNKEQQKQLCRKAVDNVVARLKGQLIKESIITIDGFEGVEARIEYKNNTEVLKMRMYLVHNKMYMLETATKMAKDNNKHIAKFMDSFRLLK